MSRPRLPRSGSTRTGSRCRRTPSRSFSRPRPQRRRRPRRRPLGRSRMPRDRRRRSPPGRTRRNSTRPSTKRCESSRSDPWRRRGATRTRTSSTCPIASPTSRPSSARRPRLAPESRGGSSRSPAASSPSGGRGSSCSTTCGATERSSSSCSPSRTTRPGRMRSRRTPRPSRGGTSWVRGGMPAGPRRDSSVSSPWRSSFSARACTCSPSPPDADEAA
mmetsp:Transcript_20343/g.47784  ORF Transcript_20343/g.47784 Transcript_20343/m.47784 type:complete len:218 (-) Transcript_20343:1270-1923(-)